MSVGRDVIPAWSAAEHHLVQSLKGVRVQPAVIEFAYLLCFRINGFLENGGLKIRAHPTKNFVCRAGWGCQPAIDEFISLLCFPIT